VIAGRARVCSCRLKKNACGLNFETTTTTLNTHTHAPLKSVGISSDPRFQSPRQTWLLSPRAMMPSHVFVIPMMMMMMMMFTCVSKARSARKKKWRDLKTPKEKKERRARALRELHHR